MTPCREMPDTDEANGAALQPTRLVLERAAAEIRRVADLLRVMQDSLGLIVSDAMASVEAQGIDLAEQTLRDLGCVLSRLSAATPDALLWDVEGAVEGCKLSAVAAAIRGIATETPTRDVDFF